LPNPPGRDKPFLFSKINNHQQTIIMKKIILSLAIIALASYQLAAADAKAYQVTGPVLEVTDSYIVVQKGEQKWELALDKSTKGPKPKVGDKVTVYYTMTATEIEAKPAKPAKSDKK
jgi:hypothetical protein